MVVVMVEEEEVSLIAFLSYPVIWLAGGSGSGVGGGSGSGNDNVGSSDDNSGDEFAMVLR